MEDTVENLEADLLQKNKAPEPGSMNLNLDTLISSISRYFLAMFSLAVAYGYLVSVELDRNRALAILAGLDKLLAVRQVVHASSPDRRPLTKRDLLDIYPRARSVGWAPNEKGKVGYTEDLDKRGFTPTPIEGGFHQYVSMKASTTRQCSAALVSAKKGVKFNFATFQIVGRAYWVKSQDVTLLSMGACPAGTRSEFNAILFKLDDEHHAVGLPRSIETEFPALAPPPGSNSFPFTEIEKLKGVLPDSISKYVNLEEDIVILHMRAIEVFTLLYASARLNQFYEISEFDVAVRDLYREKYREFRLLGISAQPYVLLGLGPIAFFLLSIAFWRRVRNIAVGGSKGTIGSVSV